MKEIMRDVCIAVVALVTMVIVVSSVMTYFSNKRDIEELEEICSNYELYLGNTVKNNEVFNQCISSTRGVYNNALDDDIDDVIIQCRYHANAIYPTLESVRFNATIRAIHRACRGN